MIYIWRLSYDSNYLLKVTVFATILFTLVSWLTPSGNKASASHLNAKKVLLISSYSLEYPIYTVFANGIKQRLAEDPWTKFQIYYESLDLLRFSINSDDLAATLKNKYATSRPDIIIVQSNPATGFVRKYGNMMFGDIPTILVPDGQPLEVNEYPELPDNYSVLAPTINLDKSVQLILDIKPATKKIYMLVGTSDFDQRLRQIAVRQLASFAGKVEFIYLDQMSFPDMMQYIRTIEGEAAILFLSYRKDASDTDGFIAAKLIKEVSAVSRVPVFGIVETFIGSGCVGGYMQNATYLAQKTAERALAVLYGTNVNNAQVERIDIASYQLDRKSVV